MVARGHQRSLEVASGRPCRSAAVPRSATRRRAAAAARSGAAARPAPRRPAGPPSTPADTARESLRAEGATDGVSSDPKSESEIFNLIYQS